MYISIKHPEILAILKNLVTGLWVAKIGDYQCLIIKATKEVILTAKLNKSFNFYVVPVTIDSKLTYTLFTAFFDDADEPLVIKTVLLANDALTNDLLELFRNETFDVFFFDELDRELLSYKAKGELPRMLQLLESMSLLEADNLEEMLNQSDFWFGHRDESDDKESVKVVLIESLFPDDLLIMDLDESKHRFNSSKSFSSTSLLRDEPGLYQEVDIVFLLQRVYKPEQIYLNPVKISDSKEFVDVMIVGEEAIILLQAKDSPNTESVLRAMISRKKIKSFNQLNSGATQLLGAINETKRKQIIHLKVGDKVTEIDFSSKQLIGIIVIKELFSDMFKRYSDVVYNLVETSRTPVVFFDYPELSEMALVCDSEDKFLSAINQIFTYAMEGDQFPRLRYKRKSYV